MEFEARGEQATNSYESTGFPIDIKEVAKSFEWRIREQNSVEAAVPVERIVEAARNDLIERLDPRQVFYNDKIATLYFTFEKDEVTYCSIGLYSGGSVARVEVPADQVERILRPKAYLTPISKDK